MNQWKLNEKGFTLMEMVLVLAIILVLASIFLPLATTKIKEADEVSAGGTISSIAKGLAAFYEDLRHFPTCDSASDCNAFASNDLVFLAFGDGAGTLASQYPNAGVGGGNWDFTVNQESSPARNNAYNHLVINNPDADVTAGEATLDYKTAGSRWRGPYVFGINFDPWDRAFIANVGAMEPGGGAISGAATSFGWILSAGPDNFLDTLPTSTALSNDDIGFIFQNASSF